MGFLNFGESRFPAKIVYNIDQTESFRVPGTGVPWKEDENFVFFALVFMHNRIFSLLTAIEILYLS